ncbi:hypothetical protein GCM10027598_64840 [Amycolatopsis oliviviridis]
MRRPAPVSASGCFSSGAAGALFRDRGRNPDRRQPRQATPVIDAGHPGEPAIHHRAHTRHGQAGLGDRRREHHPATGARAQRVVLARRRKPSVQGQHVGVQAVEQPAHPGDLARTRQEGEHVTVPFGQCFVDRPDHGRLDPLAAHGRGVRDVDRIGPGLSGDHRRVAEQRRQPTGGHGGGRREQAQVVPQAGADVQEQREQQIRVEMAFVAFVEQDGRNPGQLGVALHPPDQQPRGDHFDPRRRRHLPVSAYRVADRLTDPFPQQRRHPRRRGARGQPPRFGDDHPAFTVVQRERDQGGLTGSRGRDEDSGAMGVERGFEFGQDGANRQIGKGHCSVTCGGGGIR